MNYLFELLSTLTETELEQLTKSDIKGHERRLLDTYIDLKASNQKQYFNAQFFNLSNSHFDKVCSVLIDRVYNQLTDGSFNSVCSFLLQKALTGLLEHEIKLKQRKLMRSGNKTEMREFYETAFETLRRFSFDVLDLKMLRQFADLLKKSLSKKELLTPEIVELKYLYVENSYYYFKGMARERVGKALKNITAVLEDPESHKKEPVYGHYQLCLTAYHNDYLSNQATALYHISLAFENALLWAPKNDLNFLANIYGNKATLHSQNSEYSMAMAVYKEGFEKYGHLLEKSFFHKYMFTTIALVCGEYELTIQYLDKYFGSYLNSESALYFKTDVTRLYILYYLYTSQTEKAGKLVAGLQAIKRKELTETGDIMLRMIDTLYFLRTEEYSMAENKSRNSIRFLKSRGYNTENSVYLHFFIAASELAKSKSTLCEPNMKRIEKSLAVSQTGLLKLYGGLLQIMYNQKGR